MLANCERNKKIYCAASQKPSKIRLLEMVPTKDAEGTPAATCFLVSWMKWAAKPFPCPLAGAGSGSKRRPCLGWEPDKPGPENLQHEPPSESKRWDHQQPPPSGRAAGTALVPPTPERPPALHRHASPGGLPRSLARRGVQDPYGWAKLGGKEKIKN